MCRCSKRLKPFQIVLADSRVVCTSWASNCIVLIILADHSGGSFAATLTNRLYDLVHTLRTHSNQVYRCRTPQVSRRTRSSLRAIENAFSFSLNLSTVFRHLETSSGPPVWQTILMIIKSDCISHCELLKSQHSRIEIRIRFDALRGPNLAARREVLRSVHYTKMNRLAGRASRPVMVCRQQV